MSDPTLREFIIAIMDERERANQRALEMAATRLNERLESMNEFRSQILEERTNYAKRAELDLLLHRISQREQSNANRDGKWSMLAAGLLIISVPVNYVVHLMVTK